MTGVERRLSSVFNRNTPRYGATREDPWGLDIVGALGELAVAKVFDAYPHPDGGVGPSYGGDITRRFEVRATTRLDGSLIVHDRDPDDRQFILVRGQVPTLEVAGWIFGSQAKQLEFWRTSTGRPAYFVPAADLQPMPSLIIAAPIFHRAAS